MKVDLIIRNGRIIDGTGKAAFPADIAIKGDRIFSIGLQDADASDEIEATGCIVSPGFIDVHTHDDPALLDSPSMLPKISQGVTSVIAGNCGFSLAPLTTQGVLPDDFQLLGDKNYRFPRFVDYIETIEKSPAAVNSAFLVGHATLRCECMAALDRPADDEEIGAMRSALREALQSGALGLSTGLDYESSANASTDEIVSLAKELKPFLGIYATHTRDYFDDILGALREALEIGKRASVPVILSHHQVAGRRNFGLSAQTLCLISEAQKEQDVGLDVYPYVAGASVILPALVEKCERVVIGWSEPHPEMRGRDLSTIAVEWACEPMQAARRLVPGEAIYFEKDEADVQRILAYPRSMIGSDSVHGAKVVHPRLWGTFSRVLGHYARELGLLTLEDAVHRMTGLPAQQFRLENRGVLRDNAFADMVVFDPKRICDGSTFDDPERPALGIQAVVVNGEVAWSDGKSTGARAGRVLRRAAVQ